MSRARVDIQKDVNAYRSGIESKDLMLNSPTWANSKYDYRYQEILKKRAAAAFELVKFERELAEAKARGEKGSTPSEIRDEISSSQSNMNFYCSIRDRAGRNSMQEMISELSAEFIQCTINALRRELSEAEEESTEQGEKRREEMERKHREKEAERKRREEEAERKRREEQERQAKEKAEVEGAILELIANLTEKIQFNPEDDTIYNFRGLAYSQRGETNKAFEDFNQAILLNPDYADAYCNRGNIYVYKDNYDLAIADFDKAIQLNPNDEKAYYCRGAVYSDKKGDHIKAIADFEASLRINPNNSFARQFLEQARKLKKETDERERQAKERELHRIKEKKKRLFWGIFSILLGGIIGGLLFVFLASVADNTHFVVCSSIVCGILFFRWGYRYSYRHHDFGDVGGCASGGCAGIIAIAGFVGMLTNLPKIPFMVSIAIGVGLGAGLGIWNALRKK
jgi:tetratricopeptide (TPR) repeat protein